MDYLIHHCLWVEIKNDMPNFGDRLNSLQDWQYDRRKNYWPMFGLLELLFFRPRAIQWSSVFVLTSTEVCFLTCEIVTLSHFVSVVHIPLNATLPRVICG